MKILHLIVAIIILFLLLIISSSEPISAVMIRGLQDLKISIALFFPLTHISAEQGGRPKMKVKVSEFVNIAILQ